MLRVHLRTVGDYWFVKHRKCLSSGVGSLTGRVSGASMSSCKCYVADCVAGLYVGYVLLPVQTALVDRSLRACGDL